ncbi:hypothetical protein Sjap_007686 [Stephania japonica]|uniref:F-box domain-containing protein n=1 Tax=Stephania japonica TaxID=461633 RepID=A0AAP0PAN2_9MAGN
MRRPRRSLPELPHEILAQEILPRLPAKSLRRFKFVCKRWRDLINDPTFIDTHLLHLNHQPTSNQQINVLYTNQGRIYSRIIKLDFLSSIQVLRNPLPSADWFQPRKHVEPSFWGSCNGLVCVRTDDSLGLWNPCTGSYRALDYDPLLGPASHGFGYDANTKDYKLVVISEKQLYMGNVITPQVIRVFSLNSNSWRTLSDSVYPCSWMESGMFIDGVVYWVKFEKVICFDIHAEVFSELRLPDISFSELRLRLPDISPTHKICKIQISEIGGSLAISYLLNCIFHEVWVMVKENWIKMYSVDVLQNPLGLTISNH